MCAAVAELEKKDSAMTAATAVTASLAIEDWCTVTATRQRGFTSLGDAPTRFAFGGGAETMRAWMSEDGFTLAVKTLVISHPAGELVPWYETLVHVFDLQTNSKIFTTRTAEPECMLSADGSLLFACAGMDTARVLVIYDTRRGKAVHRVEWASTRRAVSLRFSPSGKYMLWQEEAPAHRHARLGILSATLPSTLEQVAAYRDSGWEDSLRSAADSEHTHRCEGLLHTISQSSVYAVVSDLHKRTWTWRDVRTLEILYTLAFESFLSPSVIADGVTYSLVADKVSFVQTAETERNVAMVLHARSLLDDAPDKARMQVYLVDPLAPAAPLQREWRDGEPLLFLDGHVLELSEDGRLCTAYSLATGETGWTMAIVGDGDDAEACPVFERATVSPAGKACFTTAKAAIVFDNPQQLAALRRAGFEQRWGREVAKRRRTGYEH